jgi:hypothetical protein
VTCGRAGKTPLLAVIVADDGAKLTMPGKA